MRNLECTKSCSGLLVGLKEDWQRGKTTPDKPILGQLLMTGKDVQTINSTLYSVTVDELQQKTAH